MPDHCRRAMIKKMAASGLLTGGLAGLLRDVLAAGTRPAPGINRFTGEVTVNGRPAQLAMPIGAGDTVVCGPRSEAIYVIGQDAFLQREDSTVRFAGTGIAVDTLRVISGKLLSVFGQGNKRIETSTAVIGIRGTACYIESEPTRVYFCLCYGIAEITHHAAPDRIERIETKHHDHPVYLHREASMPMMADASVINHTDAELEMLERLVGRKPPFVNTGGYRY